MTQNHTQIQIVNWKEIVALLYHKNGPINNKINLISNADDGYNKMKMIKILEYQYPKYNENHS